MLKPGGNIKPNFWRAATEADMSRLNPVWVNPGFLLKKMETQIRDGIIEIITQYTLQNVSSELYLVYRINNQGAISITQRIKMDNTVNIPAIPRFGIQIQMPYEFQKIEYYGRGPLENYADRNNSQFLGIYNQSVDEQFYSYIKPQETGTKSDVRWCKLSNKNGKGFLFISDTLFFASALHHSIEALQNTAHSPELPPEKITNFCIDYFQMGLGCVNTWGAWPLDKYIYRREKNMNFLF